MDGKTLTGNCCATCALIDGNSMMLLSRLGTLTPPASYLLCLAQAGPRRCQLSLYGRSPRLQLGIVGGQCNHLRNIQ